MAVIDDLPSEIISHIFQCLATEVKNEQDFRNTAHTARPALCALARVNRYYGKLAQDVLYSDVHVWCVDGTGRGECDVTVMDFGRSPLFYNSIQIDEILNRIQRLTLQWGKYYYYSPSEEDEAIPIELKSILQRVGQSASLFQLSIADFHLADCIPLTHPQSGTFTRLRQVNLQRTQRHGITAEFLLRICCLPALQDFSSCGGSVVVDHTGKGDRNLPTAKKLVDVVPTRDYVPIPAALSGLNLKSIDVEGHSQVLEGFFRTLLPETPQLRRFASPIFGPGCRNVRIQSRNRDCFQPKLVEDILRPLIPTLQDLSLVATSPYSIYGRNWLVVDKHDGTSIDLGGFTKLRRLKISTYLLCNGTTTKLNCMPDLNFYEKLPPSLKSLEIEIAPCQGILYHQHHLDTLVNDKWPMPSYVIQREDSDVAKWLDTIFWKWNQMPECLTQKLGWLFRMLDERKCEASILPVLRSVRIYEGFAAGFHDLKLVDLVKLYPDLFQEYADIAIQITLRGPRGWRPVHRDPVFGYAVTAPELSYPLGPWRPGTAYYEGHIVHNEYWWRDYLSKCQKAYGLSMVRPEDSAYYRSIVERHGSRISDCDICRDDSESSAGSSSSAKEQQ